MMEIIHADEVTHVTTGHRWFTWACEREGGLDPVRTFREEVRRGWRGDVKGPFNVEDRERAGMTSEFYEGLRGEMGLGVRVDEKTGGLDLKELGNALPGVTVEYER